jgi:hypothetical protein
MTLYRLGIFYDGKEKLSANIISDKDFALEQARAILELETPERVIIYEITETPVETLERKQSEKENETKAL